MAQAFIQQHEFTSPELRNFIVNKYDQGSEEVRQSGIYPVPPEQYVTNDDIDASGQYSYYQRCVNFLDQNWMDWTQDEDFKNAYGAEMNRFEQSFGQQLRRLRKEVPLGRPRLQAPSAPAEEEAALIAETERREREREIARRERQEKKEREEKQKAEMKQARQNLKNLRQDLQSAFITSQSNIADLETQVTEFDTLRNEAEQLGLGEELQQELGQIIENIERGMGITTALDAISSRSEEFGRLTLEQQLGTLERASSILQDYELPLADLEQIVQNNMPLLSAIRKRIEYVKSTLRETQRAQLYFEVELPGKINAWLQELKNMISERDRIVSEIPPTVPRAEKRKLEPLRKDLSTQIEQFRSLIERIQDLEEGKKDQDAAKQLTKTIDTTVKDLRNKMNQFRERAEQIRLEGQFEVAEEYPIEFRRGRPPVAPEIERRPPAIGEVEEVFTTNEENQWKQFADELQRGYSTIESQRIKDLYTDIMTAPEKEFFEGRINAQVLLDRLQTLKQRRQTKRVTNQQALRELADFTRNQAMNLVDVTRFDLSTAVANMSEPDWQFYGQSPAQLSQWFYSPVAEQIIDKNLTDFNSAFQQIMPTTEPQTGEVELKQIPQRPQPEIEPSPQIGTPQLMLGGEQPGEMYMGEELGAMLGVPPTPQVQQEEEEQHLELQQRRVSPRLPSPKRPSPKLSPPKIPSPKVPSPKQVPKQPAIKYPIQKVPPQQMSSKSPYTPEQIPSSSLEEFTNAAQIFATTIPIGMQSRPQYIMSNDIGSALGPVFETSFIQDIDRLRWPNPNTLENIFDSIGIQVDPTELQQQAKHIYRGLQDHYKPLTPVQLEQGWKQAVEGAKVNEQCRSILQQAQEIGNFVNFLKALLCSVMTAQMNGFSILKFGTPEFYQWKDNLAGHTRLAIKNWQNRFYTLCGSIPYTDGRLSNQPVLTHDLIEAISDDAEQQGLTVYFAIQKSRSNVPQDQLVGILVARDNKEHQVLPCDVEVTEFGSQVMKLPKKPIANISLLQNALDILGICVHENETAQIDNAWIPVVKIGEEFDGRTKVLYIDKANQVQEQYVSPSDYNTEGQAYVGNLLVLHALVDNVDGGYLGTILQAPIIESEELLSSNTQGPPSINAPSFKVDTNVASMYNRRFKYERAFPYEILSPSIMSLTFSPETTPYQTNITQRGVRDCETVMYRPYPTLSDLATFIAQLSFDLNSKEPINITEKIYQSIE